MLADICRQYETAATNPVFECRCVWMWLLPLLWSVIVTRAGYKLIFPLQIPVWHRHYAVTILSPPDLKSQTTALRTILPTWANNTTQFKYQEREGIERWSDLCENIGMFASQTDNNWLAGLGPALRSVSTHLNVFLSHSKRLENICSSFRVTSSYNIHL